MDDFWLGTRLLLPGVATSAPIAGRPSRLIATR
jgi:hypothetical protein